jgi:3-phosphoshikimate 1-carboxyvinyltransferase
MKAEIRPSELKGTIVAPASKSAMQRACAAALVRKGTTVLHNPGVSADDLAAIGIIQQLGATVENGIGTLTIQSPGIGSKGGKIDCGESGLSIRMFTSLAAIADKPITVTGKGSLMKRPLHFFEAVLPQLGVTCTSNNGYLPLLIRGPLKPKDIIIDGSLSSQYLTGLLFAYAAAEASDVTISVDRLASKPYIDLTLDVIEAFGLKVPVFKDYETFYFDTAPPPPQSEQAFEYIIEADWSGAAFLLVAGAINGSLVVKGLDIFSSQADKAILQALMQAGAVLSIEEKQITIERSRLKAFHFNATHCPDLFPPLVALAAYCDGTTVIEGVHRLTHKESNRAQTLMQEFTSLGIEVKLQDDLMIVAGGVINGAEVHAHGDHRIAMATAVAALRSKGPVTINEAEAVNKSYPKFWDHLLQLGAALSLKNN